MQMSEYSFTMVQLLQFDYLGRNYFLMLYQGNAIADHSVSLNRKWKKHKTRDHWYWFWQKVVIFQNPRDEVYEKQTTIQLHPQSNQES